MSLGQIIGPLHPMEAPPDDLLLAGVRERISSFIDDCDDTDSLAAYVVSASGRGKCVWWGHKPSQDQHRACVVLARALNALLRRELHCAWVVCLGGWAPGPDGVGRYGQTFMVPKDRDGDMGFVVDCMEPSWEIELDPEHFVDQAHGAYIEYALHLIAVDIKPEHMVKRVQGQGTPDYVPAIVDQRRPRRRAA